MARKKVKLQWIANDSARRATYKKRKKGMMKKVSELSTLCGVSACAILYGPYEPQPEVWPNHSDAHRVLTRFKSLPDIEQSKKMMNQEGFLRDRINKLKEQIKKQQKENRQYEVAQLMNDILGGTRGLHDVGLDHLTDLASIVEEKMKSIQERIQEITKENARVAAPAPAPAPPQQPPPRMQHHVPVPTTVEAQSGVLVAAPEGDKTALDMAMEALKTQPWFSEMMSPQEQMGVVENMMLPYHASDYNPWANGFYP